MHHKPAAMPELEVIILQKCIMSLRATVLNGVAYIEWCQIQSILLSDALRPIQERPRSRLMEKKGRSIRRSELSIGSLIELIAGLLVFIRFQTFGSLCNW